MYKFQAVLLSIAGFVAIGAISGCFIIAVWFTTSTSYSARWAYTGLILLPSLVIYLFFMAFVWEDVGTSTLIKEKNELQARNDSLRTRISEAGTEIYDLKEQLKQARNE